MPVTLDQVFRQRPNDKVQKELLGYIQWSQRIFWAEVLLVFIPVTSFFWVRIALGFIRDLRMIFL